jgi:carbon storage regulator
MLVLSREAGMSIFVGAADETCVVTLLKVFPAGISMLVNRASASRPGQLDSRTVAVDLNSSVKISTTAELTLVDVRGDKARVGINAPSQSSVHRLEVYEAIKRETPPRGDGGDPEDGMTGSPFPRPTSPKPPSLDSRLDEPRSADDSVE